MALTAPKATTKAVRDERGRLKKGSQLNPGGRGKSPGRKLLTEVIDDERQIALVQRMVAVAETLGLVDKDVMIEDFDKYGEPTGRVAYLSMEHPKAAEMASKIIDKLYPSLKAQDIKIGSDTGGGMILIPHQVNAQELFDNELTKADDKV